MVCTQYTFSTTFVVPLTTICCISGILAVVENLVVLLVVRKIHSLRSTARYFMASLAAAELLSGFIANLYYILNHSRRESIWAKTETAVWSFTTASVTFSLIMSNVAVDRYIAISSPLQYHNRMTSTRCLSLIIFSWCLASLVASAAYVISGENLVDLWICGAVIFVFIPFCIIACCYYKIYRATRNTFPVRENITDVQQIAENNRQRKIAYTFGIITGLFILLFMPSFIFNCFYLGDPPDVNGVKCNYFRRKLWISVAVISFFSAIFDPWVYAIRMPDLKMALKQLFRSMCSVL